MQRFHRFSPADARTEKKQTKSVHFCFNREKNKEKNTIIVKPFRKNDSWEENNREKMMEKQRKNTTFAAIFESSH